MTRTKFDRSNPTRRELLVAGAGAGALVALGCGGGGGDGGLADAGAIGGGLDGGLPDLGLPEVSSALWQMMTPYARASADGATGTRINLYNPATLTQRVVIQAFTMDGQLVLKEELWEAMAPFSSWHLELGEVFAERNLPLPFEGTVWIGTTPLTGQVFMGLQGISFDWYGPGQLASVHSMRDFGNSNHDGMWTDMILPKVVSSDRYVSRIAILNASGDGISEALIARPEVIIREDDGTELVRVTLDDLPPYCARLVDVGELLDGAELLAGTIQVREPAAGLVALGFLFDTDNDGIACADHFFDRHFVVDETGFSG